jgi:hypothetical protein
MLPRTTSVQDPSGQVKTPQFCAAGGAFTPRSPTKKSMKVALLLGSVVGVMYRRLMLDNCQHWHVWLLENQNTAIISPGSRNLVQ